QGEGKVHLVVGVGKSSPMVKIEAGKVRLIEHDELLQRGKKVWFRRSTTGHADGRLDSGIVQYAVGKSGYAVKGSDGTIYKVPWAFVAPT
ncbi:MAG: hypothetical protein KJO07_02085, partial [Deltaproteobacteria bacterium]|nr:hypothetical protein [Deltaproteobacteria bacterium]